jgi:hypothetical protein
MIQDIETSEIKCDADTCANCNAKSYSDPETSSESATSLTAATLVRLTEKIGCLGFAPVRADKSMRVCICWL